MDKTECNANRGNCSNAVERAHTNSLDANDKLIQTRLHVRNTIASRKRQVVMRKGKSTILQFLMGAPSMKFKSRVLTYVSDSWGSLCKQIAFKLQLLLGTI